MPQQINLCPPLQSKQTDFLSAQILMPALAIFVVIIGGLCVYWVLGLNSASEGFKKSLHTQSLALNELQSALAQGKAGVGVADASLTQDAQRLRAELLQREALLKWLQRGLFLPGWGHAARLQLVAQSIPAKVWVTELKADDIQLEISGSTLDPSALSGWVSKLASSPLLKGHKLTTVKVEYASPPAVKTAVGMAFTVLPAASLTQLIASPPVWVFTLVSTVDKPSVVAGGNP